MMRDPGSVTALVTTVCLVACGPPGSPSEPLTARDRASIDAVRRSFVEAELAGDWRRQANLFRADGALLESQGPGVVGRAAIRAGLEEFRTTADSFALRSLELAGNGALAVDRGRYALRVPRDGSPVRDSGWYLMVLTRDRTGWRIAALTHHSDREAVPPPSAPLPGG